MKCHAYSNKVIFFFQRQENIHVYYALVRSEYWKFRIIMNEGVDIAEAVDCKSNLVLIL